MHWRRAKPRGCRFETPAALLETARANGKVGGRRPALTPQRAKLALDMLDAGVGVTKVAEAFSVSRQTIYRLVEAGAH